VACPSGADTGKYLNNENGANEILTFEKIQSENLCFSALIELYPSEKQKVCHSIALCAA
jgi:hypothetical protein